MLFLSQNRAPFISKYKETNICNLILINKCLNPLLVQHRKFKELSLFIYELLSQENNVFT